MTNDDGRLSLFGCGCGGVDALCADANVEDFWLFVFAEMMSASEIIGALVIIACCIVIA